MIGRGPSGQLGTTRRDDGTWEAICWAPHASRVAAVFGHGGGERVELDPCGDGYFAGALGSRESGARYWFELDGEIRLADPASRRQPDGVSGPSALFDPDEFVWSDGGFDPPAMRDLILYELHVGTFSAPLDPTVPGGRRPGTFVTAAMGLSDLVALGVNAVEPMPIAAFPGTRNWGYDGVFPFAAQESYGGPVGFQRFVDAAHRAGVAVVLDVVYNHFGPEGAVFANFGPYTSAGHRTPWGEGMNVDRAWSDEVRRYFLENARMWLVDFHVDGLRLDAIHAIVDTSARPFLAELADHVASIGDAYGRPYYLIAESDDNNPRVITPTARGGYGMDGQWADDFHHALHVALTGERQGYYADYTGTPELARAIGSGYAYTGQYATSRRRRHGAPAPHATVSQFVVAAENHDQVGNRPGSERLSGLVSPAALRLAAGVLLCSPHVPLLFMGDEDAEPSPFAYFVDYADPELLEAVRIGRAAEMGEEGSLDPAAPETFARSCLTPAGDDPVRRAIRRWYGDLIDFRRTTPIVTDPVAHTESDGEDGTLSVLRRSPVAALWFVANPSRDARSVEVPAGVWRLVLSSERKIYRGPGVTAPGLTAGPGTFRLAPEGFACYLEEDRNA